MNSKFDVDDIYSMLSKSPVCLMVALVGGCLVHLNLESASAQDDPFGQPAVLDPGPAAKPLDNPPAADVPDLDVTTRAIVESNPQTPDGMLNAADLLLDLDRDDLALPFVRKIDQLELNDQQLFELYRNAGPDRVVRIGLRGGLGGDGKALSQKIVEGASRYATSDQRIDQLIDQVISEDTWQRSRGLGDLRLLGDVGAAALVDRLRDDRFQPYWPRIRSAIGYFGETAMGPLVAAWNSNSAKLRVEALMALGNIPVDESIETLLGPANGDPGSMNQVVAARSLKRIMGRVPDRPESELVLYESARHNLMGKRGGRHASADVRWWRWDPATRKLVMSWMNPQTATRIRGYRRARDLVGMNPDREDFQRLYWVARLESAKLAGGIDQPLSNRIRSDLAGQLDTRLANQVLSDAMELHRLPAAVAACEILADQGEQRVLFAEDGNLSPLVRALGAGSIRLTAAAARAIDALEPNRSFPGSSQYVDALVYLARSSGTPLAVVGHVNDELARTIAGEVGRAGYEGRIAGSARELLQEANRNPDLQLLVVSDMLGPPGYAELFQTLRVNPRTREIPVLLLVQPRSLEEAQRMTARYPAVLVSPVIREGGLLARQLANLRANADYTDAGPAERMQYGQAALNQLAAFGRNPQKYPYVDLSRHEAELSQLLVSPASALQTCQVLGRIATADAQQNLLNLASNPELPLELRQTAAESFAQAVGRSGIMLQRDALEAQYLRYNTSSRATPETREILGYLLDVIEGRVDPGHRDRPPAGSASGADH